MRVSDEDLKLLDRYGVTAPVRLDQLIADLRDARCALREIADNGCDSAASKTCRAIYPTNREEWCGACIATEVLNGE